MSFLTFRFQYKGQNRRLGNLGNFQLPPTKQLQVLKKCPRFRVQYQGQNRKLGNLGNLKLFPTKQLQTLKKFPSFPSFRVQYKYQNWKLRNLENLQLPPTKQLYALKNFPSFPSFWFQCKEQNRKLGNVENLQLQFTIYNFKKTETESKMENPTHSFRNTNLVFQLIQESQIKSKTVMSWSSRKKGIFYTVHFVRRKFFKYLFYLNV